MQRTDSPLTVVAPSGSPSLHAVDRSMHTTPDDHCGVDHVLVEVVEKVANIPALKDRDEVLGSTRGDAERRSCPPSPRDNLAQDSVNELDPAMHLKVDQAKLGQNEMCQVSLGQNEMGNYLNADDQDLAPGRALASLGLASSAHLEPVSSDAQIPN